MDREHAETAEMLTAGQKSDIEIIIRMYRQQKRHFERNNPRESVKDRIVSISKPYVRPIVRGKEVKSVEFGAKCNNILVDGLSFIDKLSFNAFNEGTRLPHCLKMHRRFFGVEAKKVGGDAGYAGNANRELFREKKIRTSFAKRGRPALVKKEDDIIRKELARVRATRMEGSFGTQKEHYGLRRIKARTRRTEILYIFFGHPHGERGTACPERSRRNCSGRLMFHMWNGTFTGVLVPVVARNEKIGSDTKPMA